MNLPTDFPPIPAGLRGNDPQFSVPYLCSTRTKRKTEMCFWLFAREGMGTKQSMSQNTRVGERRHPGATCTCSKRPTDHLPPRDCPPPAGRRSVEGGLWWRSWACQLSWWPTALRAASWPTGGTSAHSCRSLSQSTLDEGCDTKGPGWSLGRRKAPGCSPCTCRRCCPRSTR